MKLDVQHARFTQLVTRFTSYDLFLIHPLLWRTLVHGLNRIINELDLCKVT